MKGLAMPDNKQGSDRGFSSMDKNKQREIASEGGRASGGNFANDPKRASEAGRKGGQQSAQDNKQEGQQGSQGGRGGGEEGRSEQRGGQQRAEGNADGRQQGSGQGGYFADDRERASEAGRKGGRS